MTRARRVVATTKAFLAVLFAVLVVLQTFSLPGQFAHMADESPGQAHLRWPLTALAIFWVCCAQVVIVCTWKLLTMVRYDRIFDPRAMVWVDGILWTIGAGWSVFLAVFLIVGFRADDPGLPLLLFLLLVAGAVFGLVIVVMRSLLRQATALRADMDAVI
jgi:hypothetical protein